MIVVVVGDVGVPSAFIVQSSYQRRKREKNTFVHETLMKSDVARAA